MNTNKYLAIWCRTLDCFTIIVQQSQVIKFLLYLVQTL